MDGGESALARLLAIEGVRRCKADYFRCLDEQRWDDLVALFTPDAEIDMRGSVEPHDPALLSHDPARFFADLAALLAGVTTRHVGMMPLIDIVADDEAQAVWSMEDLLWVPGGHPALPPGLIHGWGHYHERYVRADGGWRIAATRLTRIRLEHCA